MDVQVGMEVIGSDHAKLGRVVRVDGRGFLVRRGTSETRVQRAEVIRLDGDKVVVAQHRPEVAQAAGRPGRRRYSRKP